MSEKPVDRRTQKTRKALCDALAELLLEKELHKVTVQEISDKANVNRVTFYKHYLDVYDLYEKIEDSTLVELGLMVLQLEELPLRDFFAHIISYISENRTIFRMIFSPLAAPTVMIRFFAAKAVPKRRFSDSAMVCRTSSKPALLI